MSGPLRDELFRRQDEAPDAEFYATPRFVTHIDPETIAALTKAYGELLTPGASVLDLMSSWISHLPPDATYSRVAGLGMNRAELVANPRLSDFVVHDLNVEPALPYADESFDAVMNAVSIQYLTRPAEVFASIAKVLRPGGLSIVAMSHRMFPTKAIAAFHALPPPRRVQLVMTYYELAGGFSEPQFLDRSPSNADPLWLVLARHEGGA